MFAKRFFYVCGGLLCLALAYHLGARFAGAQAVTSQETAVLTGEVADGGTIPLPHYHDGSEALESECTWTVSPQTLVIGTEQTRWPTFERCSTSGRTVRVYWCISGCVAVPPDCVSTPAGCPGPLVGTANYMIIAVRNSTPTPVQRTSLGALKVRYR